MYKNNVSKKEKKRYIISSLHPSKEKNNKTPLNTMIQKLTLPLRVTTLISKTIRKLQLLEIRRLGSDIPEWDICGR